MHKCLLKVYKHECSHFNCNYSNLFGYLYWGKISLCLIFSMLKTWNELKLNIFIFNRNNCEPRYFWYLKFIFLFDWWRTHNWFSPNIVCFIRYCIDILMSFCFHRFLLIRKYVEYFDIYFLEFKIFSHDKCQK